MFKNIDLLSKLPFSEELSVIKIDKAFRRYAYKVELIDKKDTLLQLEVSKSNIIDLFHDFLDEKKRFKYRITIKILLKKYKSIEIEFSPVYFN